MRAQPAYAPEVFAAHASRPAPEPWAAHLFRHARRCNSPGHAAHEALPGCKHYGLARNPHSSPRGCSRAGHDSNKHHNSRGPCIHIRNRRRHSSRCSDPNSRNARDRRRYRSPTMAASRAHPPTAPAPRHREPSNSQRRSNSNNPASKRNHRRALVAECNRGEAAEVRRPAPAVRKRCSDRNLKGNRRWAARNSERMKPRAAFPPVGKRTLKYTGPPARDFHRLGSR